MLTHSPETIFAILKSASSATPDARLGDVLEAFRGQWRAIGSRKYPWLGPDVEDAIQDGLLKLVSARKLALLDDPARVEGWARTVFVHGLIDMARDRRRELTRRSVLGGPEDDPEEILRDRLPSWTPTPEELAEQRERVEIVARCIDRLEVARLRFVDGLPEKEIAARRGLTRDAVAAQLKRLRRVLRTALGEPKDSGG